MNTRTAEAKAARAAVKRRALRWALAALLVGVGSLALMGCGVVSSTATPAPAPTGIYLPTLAPVGATILPSDRGLNQPTLVPQSQGEPASVPTQYPEGGAPGASNPLDYIAALRPESVKDFRLADNKTVYIIQWDVSDDLSEINGTQRVVFANRTGQPLNEIYFRLFPNLPDSTGKLDVQAVRIRRSPANYSIQGQGTVLRVPLTTPLQPNEVIPIALDYRVTVPTDNQLRYADLTRNSWIATLPTVYPIIPAYDATGWHLELPPAYGDLVYADSSIYDVTITTPSRYEVITSGDLVRETPNGDRTTRRFIGAPMRDFDVNISAQLVKSSAQVGDVTINSWYLPDHEEGGKKVLDSAVGAFQTFESRFGPYPFNELDVVETPTTAGGIEYPGLVTINSRMYENPNETDFLDFVAAHETAHQWFYSTVGSDQVNDPWLDEALAEFATMVYLEDVRGPAVADRMREQLFTKPYAQAKLKYGDMPVGLPVNAYTEDEYSAFVYQKGMLFFEEVRRLLGEAEFFAALRRYYDRFKFQIATPQDLIDEFNRHGANVTPLYDKWILGS